MQNQHLCVDGLVMEYANIGDEIPKNEGEWVDLRNKLQTEGGWTVQGAEHLVNLARNYGFFILRNALALAVALGIEDGELGL